ncbi:MAG TPA: hypothetical protein VMJ75_17650 [Candidatus Acidoferrales bacterium]|nr:hypothetical protein [Candidatus Acidoferrales bacterium]
MKRTIGIITATLCLMASCPLAWGQAPPSKLNCNQPWFVANGLVPYCELRETSIPVGSSLAVRVRGSGSITVQSWTGPDVLVREQVETAAENEALAQAVAAQVTVDTSTGNILGGGPTTNIDQTWSLNLEVFVPQAPALDLNTLNGELSVTGVPGPVQFHSTNGSISASDVPGAIQFQSTNGTVSLVGVTGDVTGQAVNGKVRVRVGGDHWLGQTIDVKVINGAIELDVPHDCSAHVQLSIVVGVIRTNFPVPYWGKHGLGQTVTFDVGSGGPLLRASTITGSILLRRLP